MKHLKFAACLLGFALFAAPAPSPAANGVGRGGGDLVMTRFMNAAHLAQLGMEAYRFQNSIQTSGLQAYRSGWSEVLKNLHIEIGEGSKQGAYLSRSVLARLLPPTIEQRLRGAPDPESTILINRSAMENFSVDQTKAVAEILRITGEIAGVPVQTLNSPLITDIARAGIQSSQRAMRSAPRGSAAAKASALLLRAKKMAIARLSAAPAGADDVEIDRQRGQILSKLKALQLGETLFLSNLRIAEAGRPKAAYASSLRVVDATLLGLALGGVGAVAQSSSGELSLPQVFVSLPYLKQSKPSEEELAVLLIHEAGHLAGIEGPSTHERLDRYAAWIILRRR